MRHQQHCRDRRIYNTYQPLHLIAAIATFNHPINQVADKIAPDVAANNTMILKPSLQTALSAHYILQLGLECGLPPNMVKVICFSRTEVAEALVTSSIVEIFTCPGGNAVGQQIAPWPQNVHNSSMEIHSILPLMLARSSVNRRLARLSSVTKILAITIRICWWAIAVRERFMPPRCWTMSASTSPSWQKRP